MRKVNSSLECENQKLDLQLKRLQTVNDSERKSKQLKTIKETEGVNKSIDIVEKSVVNQNNTNKQVRSRYIHRVVGLWLVL